VLESIAVRLGAPSVPEHAMRFDGSVCSERRAGDERRHEVGVRAVTDLGAHATGTVVLTLPAGA